MAARLGSSCVRLFCTPGGSVVARAQDQQSVQLPVSSLLRSLSFSGAAGGGTRRLARRLAAVSHAATQHAHTTVPFSQQQRLLHTGNRGPLLAPADPSPTSPPTPTPTQPQTLADTFALNHTFWSPEKFPVWTDKGSGARLSVAIFRPDVKNIKHNGSNVFALGDHAMARGRGPRSQWGGPSNAGACLLVTEGSDEKGDYLAEPDYTSLKRVWNDSGSGANKDVSLWTFGPKSELADDYIGLGVISINNHRKPSREIVSRYRCVRSDLVEKFVVHPDPDESDPVQRVAKPELIWNDRDSRADANVSLFLRPDSGTFTAKPGYYRKPPHLFKLKSPFHFPTLSTQEVFDALHKFAPRIHMHPRERFFPSTVALTYQKLDEGEYQVELGTDGNGSTHTYLIAPLSDSSDFSHPHFRGCRGDFAKAAMYAYWLPNDLGVVDMAYFVYYPYNRGKERASTVWGNHVGDWEHITVRCMIQPDRSVEPFLVSLAYHSDNHFVKWDSSSLNKHNNTHPIVYSALDSHGFHHRAGSFEYQTTLGLTDETDDNSNPWDTWNTGEFYCLDPEAKTINGNADNYPSWMDGDFTNIRARVISRWGNPEQDSLFGRVARLEDGPTGPRHKHMIAKSYHFD
eukprot:m.100920 g.100920  ORF g.100920 m.100920 type:complete len:627 (-) comp15425_c0_seq2:75-1955(-)